MAPRRFDLRGLFVRSGVLAPAALQHQVAALPDTLPPLQGVRVVDAGLELGRVRKGRFEPAHALALALRHDAIGSCLDLGADDLRLERYLAGHPLEAGGDDGWLVVAVEGHPLGWGRRSRGTVKNRYPKGLRRTG